MRRRDGGQQGESSLRMPRAREQPPLWSPSLIVGKFWSDRREASEHYQSGEYHLRNQAADRQAL